MRALTIALGLVIAVNLSGAGGGNVVQAAPSSAPAKPVQTLRAAVVQMRSTRNLDENLARSRKYLAQCARDGVQVAVFPECALSGYFDNKYMQGLTAAQLNAAEARLGDACRDNKISAIVGTAHREGDKLYDSAVVIDSKGRVLERYHKMQLAESWPNAGDHLSVFKIDGVPCSIIICHDERYPELVRLPVLAGARVVFYLSHESGLKEERKLNPYRAQIQARAVENSVYILQANAPANDDMTGSHGQSRIIGPDGNILREATMFGDETSAATLDLRQATGRLAQRSLGSVPLGDWWREGIKRVHIIE